MPSGPTYETGDDTIAIGALVRMPGSGSGFIKAARPEQPPWQAPAPGRTSELPGPGEQDRDGLPDANADINLTLY
jgi:hypothetical protein